LGLMGFSIGIASTLASGVTKNIAAKYHQLIKLSIKCLSCASNRNYQQI